MNNSDKDIDKLFQKYLNNSSTREEFDVLLNAVREGDSDETLHRLLRHEWQAGASHQSRRSSLRWYSVAAIFIFLITTSIFIWRGGGEAREDFASGTEVVAVLDVTSINLPDGSSVRLREGSRLDIDSLFDNNTREVSLMGEAFFDVASNPLKPFIIHTGKVKTTVLGTAFTIKANSADEVITVTVARGKVMVEDEGMLLATVDADRQLVYNTKSNRVTEKVVEVGEVLQWGSHNLIFRNSSFEQIVQEVSDIYGVTIIFEDDALKQRQITASLDDRDDIDTILDILCTAQRSYFEKVGDVYVIMSLED